MRALEMIRDRSADLVRQAEGIREMEMGGEGSSSGVELRMLEEEIRFLRDLACNLAGMRRP